MLIHGSVAKMQMRLYLRVFSLRVLITLEKASFMKMIAIRSAKFSSVNRVMKITKALASVATPKRRISPAQMPIQNLNDMYSKPKPLKYST